MRVASLPKLIVLGAVVCLLAGVMLADSVAAADDVAPGVEWTDQFGTAEDDEGWAVAVDAGGVYVTGWTTGSLPGQTNAGSSDVFVRKYDTAGNGLWTGQFGTVGQDRAYGVAVDDSGVYVTGSTRGALPGQTSAGGEDVFVRKYDLAGKELWTRQLGTSGDDVGWGVAVDATGVYVTGWTQGALPGQTRAGGEDVFVRKYDPEGNELWTRQFGTSSGDNGTGVAVDATGVYVSGWTDGTLPGQTSAGSRDVFVRRYDPEGDELWTRQFGTSSGEGGTGVAVGASGVYVIGETNGAFPGQTSAGTWDVFVRRYDLDGNELWTRQFGTSSGDDGAGVAVDAGGVYVTGWTRRALPGHTNLGSSDVFVRQYDPDGNEVWTRQFGTTDLDEGKGIAADESGVYLAGRTYGAFPNQTNAGEVDMWVGRFDPNTPTCLGWGVTIAGTETVDTLVGTWRFDVIDARGGDDTVYGRGGNDLICGGDGNDQLYGGPDDDLLDGGEGADTVSGGDGNDRLHGGNGDDTVAGNQGTDYLNGGDGNDTLRGWSGRDYLHGGLGKDALYGGPDHDALFGAAGADSLVGGAGNDGLHGGDGDDTVAGNLGTDQLYGGDGNDTLRGWIGNDFLQGHYGHDLLIGGEGADLLYGSPGDDTLNGDSGDDRLDGHQGNDTLNGGDGNDTLRGLTGTDILNGGLGDDWLYGGDGADTLSGGEHSDNVYGGTGDDVVSGNQGSDTLWGGAGSDTLRGWTGNDMLNGGADNDSLYGGDDDDTLNGENGDDELDGGDGTDTLDGGPDDDECTRGEIYESCEVVV